MWRYYIKICRKLHYFVIRAAPRLRAILVRSILGVNATAIGEKTKFRGLEFIHLGHNFRIGDFCWIEAITEYADQHYSPKLSIGNDVCVSDLTHISCLEYIEIGDGCLLGSKIYIGDHSHGPTHNLNSDDLSTYPSRRPLANPSAIHIGAGCWLGDGVVILGGTRLAAGCIVGANSVVRLICDRPAVVAGVPATIIRYLD
ncbi:acyltransferase [Noviherbaspirillum sedimenti]|uniref:Acyltransferase n=2 Tax=Noviherbaspirillum sedimenti TaxID=2320865 RepID=A0A3A3G764_9BURK|nr:acyltransferase [Noviherbaspirillum sedimenti]